MTKSKKRIAPYIMDKEKCIGKGGFSEVYLCEHEENGKTYAVKVIKKAESI
jgi:serine/threonine protein kinase